MTKMQLENSKIQNEIADALGGSGCYFVIEIVGIIIFPKGK